MGDCNKGKENTMFGRVFPDCYSWGTGDYPPMEHLWSSNRQLFR